MVAQWLDWIKSFFGNAIGTALQFISNLLGGFFQSLIDFFKLIFRPVLMVVAILFYFIYKIGELIGEVFGFLLSVGKLIYAFVQGLFVTLAGLTWTPTTPVHGTWSAMFENIFQGLEFYQLDVVAYILLFAIWIMTAISALKILSGGAGGGEG